MSAQSYTFKQYTPEERASYRAHLFGSTLDWSSRILVEINFPAEEFRWFVDAVCGVCKGKERRIAHATLATRAQRFKNPAQAKALAKRAIDATKEWQRAHLRMIFDIESPKPGEREGKDKRARTRYTDYLTPAAVWAQEVEHRTKKTDELRWKKDAEYRRAEQRKILAAAINMLPSFERVEDLPPASNPPEKKPLSISEYAEQRRAIMLAEDRRIHDRICEGDLTDEGEIKSRIATLEVHYSKAMHELKKSFEATRSYLSKLKSTRLARAAAFSYDPPEVVAEIDKILAAKGYAGVPLSDPTDAPLEFSRVMSENSDVPPSDPADELAPWLREIISPDSKGYADVPLSHLPLNCTYGTKGAARVPLSDEFSAAVEARRPTQLDCALKYAALGIPVFPTKPDKTPYTQNGFKNATTDPEQIRAWWKKHPDAGIGVPTGKASGLIVLDIDPDKGGDESLSMLVLEHGDLPPTSHAKTPRNGDHFYFKDPTETEVRNSESKIGKGIDIRGNGGYAVLPGCDPGRRWTNALDAAEAPAWLVELAVAKKTRETVKTDKAGLIIPFAGTHVFYEGERHSGLRDVAWGRQIHAWAETEDELVEQVLAVNRTRCVPPLPEDEAEGLARSAAQNCGRERITI
jgi:hypothetical protein